MQRTFFIKAIWDKKEKVYYSKSDIHGLHIETETLDEFESVMMKMAVEMIVHNHRSAPDFAQKSMEELMPAILWQRPEEMSAVV